MSDQTQPLTIPEMEAQIKKQAKEKLHAYLNDTYVVELDATRKPAFVSKATTAILPKKAVYDAVEKLFPNSNKADVLEWLANAPITPRVKAVKPPPVIPPISSDDLRKTPECYYYPDANKFMLKDGDGYWTAYDLSHTRQALSYAGVQDTSIDPIIQSIRVNKCVDAIGDLAGFEEGYHKFDCGVRYLITHSPHRVMPKEGDWKYLKCALTDMFGEEQLYRLFGWLQHAIKNVADTDAAPLLQNALYIAGPPASAKTLIMQLLLRLISNRIANPYLFIMGESSFNGEMASSEVLLMGDAAGGNFETMSKMTMILKEIVSETDHLVHAKHKEPKRLPLKRVIVATCNEDISSLQIVPQLGSSMMERTILLHVKQRPDISKLGVSKEIIFDRNKLIELLEKDLPGLAYHIIYEHKVKEEDIDKRFGVKPYHDEWLVQRVNMSSQLKDVMNTIDKAFGYDTDEEHTAIITGKSNEIFYLIDTVLKMKLDRAYNRQSSFNHRLETMAVLMPDRIIYCKETEEYTIYPPERVNEDGVEITTKVHTVIALEKYVLEKGLTAFNKLQFLSDYLHGKRKG